METISPRPLPAASELSSNGLIMIQDCVQKPGARKEPSRRIYRLQGQCGPAFPFCKRKKKEIAGCEADRDPETDTGTDKGGLRATGGTPAAAALEGSWDRYIMSQTYCQVTLTGVSRGINYSA